VTNRGIRPGATDDEHTGSLAWPRRWPSSTRSDASSQLVFTHHALIKQYDSTDGGRTIGRDAAAERYDVRS